MIGYVVSDIIVEKPLQRTHLRNHFWLSDSIQNFSSHTNVAAVNNDDDVC